MIDPMTLEVREFDPYDHTLVGMGRKPNPKNVEELAESIRLVGQLQPADLFQVPREWHTMPASELLPLLESYAIDRGEFGPHTRYVVICGNNRRPACRLANKPFRGVVRPVAPSALDALRAQLEENLKRKSVSALEQGFYLDQFVKVLPKGLKIEQIATAMGFKPSTLQLYLAPTNIPEPLHPMLEGLGATIVRRVGQMEEKEHMPVVLEFARGGATLAAVNKYIKQLGKTVGRKRSRLTGTVDGLAMTQEIKPSDTGTTVGERLVKLGKKFLKEGDLPAHTLDRLLA